jgi:hypothetical protein
VTTTSESGLRSASDQDQVDHCLTEWRVFFTQDHEFLRLDTAGVAHAGIAYRAKGSSTVREIILGLVRIWEGLDPHEMPGRVEFL